MNNPWDRVHEREALWAHFEQGRNIAMFAPRRLGKTWLMKELLLKDAEEKDWCGIYCDLQGRDTCEGAVMELVKEIQNSSSIGDNLLSLAKAKLSGLLEGNVGTVQDILKQTDWSNLLEAVLSSLSNEAGERPVLIMLDEVTVCTARIMKKSLEQGHQFLDILRKTREKHRDIRWMLTGSIGIDHLTAQYQVTGAFNNLHPFLLQPFDPEVAKLFVEDFCMKSVRQSFCLTGVTHSYLQGRLGWLSPYYLEKLCLQIVPTGGDGDDLSATSEDIDRACEQLLEHPYNRVFSGWPDHLKRNIPEDDRAVCKRILDHLSENPGGDSMDTLRLKFEEEIGMHELKKGVRILVNDGFLKRDPQNGRLQFVMQLLADYWNEYYA